VRRIARAILWGAAYLGITAGGRSWAQISTATLRQANDALQEGQADRALALLTPLPTRGAGAAEAQNLICRVRLSLKQWDSAAKACGVAVQMDGQSSDFHMWLGRSLGEQAGRATFVTAFMLGRRVLSEFQQAVQLDPRNAGALSDLGQFYRDAPAIIGGGLDKADAIAAQLEKVNPAKAYELRGNIAVTRKDYGTAERDYRQAIAVSPHPAEQWTRLASFYRDRKRWSDMDTAIRAGYAAAGHDKESGVGLYDGAGILFETNRDPALAVKMLEDYLANCPKSEEAPAFVAHVRLGLLMQRLGDAAGARQQFAASAAMASGYGPSQEQALKQ
jgi:tetratricopeptide (TPR) repeat protein